MTNMKKKGGGVHDLAISYCNYVSYCMLDASVKQVAAKQP